MKMKYLFLILFFPLNYCFSQEIVINEFCSSNSSLIMDANGNYSDWIELYNNSSIDLNLFDYSLSDNIDEPRKWIFPNIEIPANGFLLVFASGENSIIGGELHTNFKIKAEGETLILSDNQNQIIDLIDPIELSNDQSYARISDGNSNWRISDAPTPNESNGSSNELICSHPSGFYKNGLFLTLSSSNPNHQIFFTLNGSIPTPQSTLYENPPYIPKNPIVDNKFSSIPTTPLSGPPILDDFIWKEPTKVALSSVVRFASFENGEIQSKVYTKNYFIGEEFENRYSFPIVNITIDSLNLFDFENGIYIPGKRFSENGFIHFPEGNYLNEGSDWERDVHITFFERDGSLGFESDGGIRMHGNGSASFPQKSFKVYFRNEYGQNELDYRIFEDSDNQKYKRLLFRNAGNDFLNTHFKDALLQNLISELDVDLQAFQPSIVFINGEYWGIHNMKLFKKLNNFCGVK